MTRMHKLISSPYFRERGLPAIKWTPVLLLRVGVHQTEATTPRVYTYFKRFYFRLNKGIQLMSGQSMKQLNKYREFKKLHHYTSKTDQSQPTVPIRYRFLNVNRPQVISRQYHK